ncbi:MAG TPA: LamG-like jellyroll fold domain-containing protein [Verrucomicrobiae bacterium]|jgi:uncharacterized protein YjdB|nr:LamG-like jellyroll fold domain-containing protein [Verrucomicrobiae bacterium]
MKKQPTCNSSQTGFARATSRFLIALALPLIALASPLSAQTLVHRYSFATDATDSVGGANGTLNPGNNAATINNGLMLPGTGTSANPSGYVSLPNALLTNDTSITVECWVTQNTANTWAEIWSFGVNGGSVNFGLIPHPGNNGNNMEVAFTPNSNERDLQTTFAFPNNTQEYVAVTYNNANLTGSLFLNGALNASTVLPNATYSPGTYKTTLDTFGLDPFGGDAQFNGTIAELRIWNGVVSQRYLSASALLGPGVLVSNVTPTSVTLKTTPAIVITGTEQATANVTLQQTGTNALLATLDATNWTSANPNVLSVNSSGLITGVGAGTTTVSATINGTTATSGSITVTPQTLTHRYSFATDATDSVGGANGTLVAPTNGSPATISNGLNLPGTTTGGFGASGYVSLPNGIVQGDSSVTVECWVTQNAANTWAEIWDLGSSTSINFGLIPVSPTPNMRVAFEPNGGENDVVAPALVSGSQQYLVTTYNNSTLNGRLYLNGLLDGSTTFPNTTYSPGSYGGTNGTTENMLGNDVFGDDQFNGTIKEFRIWSGAVTPLYVAVSAAAGPSVVVANLTPSQVTVSVSNTTMIGTQTQQATVAANFADATGVTVTSAATNWTSSSTNILTVSSTGLITAQSGGTATVSATVGGVTATSPSITVALTAPRITSQPVTLQSLVVGDTANFSVQAVGGNLSYQWSDGANAIAGATNATLTLTNVQVSSAGNYTVLVTNSLGSTNSTISVLTVVPSVLQHRYSFVSDASDSVGNANGTLVPGNNPATISNGLMLPGTGTSGTPSGYVSLPNNLLSGDTSVTVECWVTENQANTWAEIWSFGVNGGSVNFGLIPSSPTPNIKVAFTPNGGENDINSPISLPVGSQQYVAVTYNNGNLTGSLFLNGALNASTVLPNATYSPGTYNTTLDTLGSDPFGGDAQFNGTINELRIWKGVVSPLYLAVSSVAGPSVIATNLTPTEVDVTETNATLIVGQTEIATATANFAGAPGVLVTPFITNWVSSAPGVVSVNSNGVITAVSSGSATISATLAGVTGTSTAVTVPASAPVIVTEPADSDSLLVGGTLNATIGVVGNEPITFFWFFNNGAQPISISTSPTLTIPNVQLANAGSYTCLVSNQIGTIGTTPLVLTVTAPTTYQQALLQLGPLGYWPLNETSGTIAYDAAGSYNGTYEGQITQGQPGPTNAFFGDSSLSAFFDGSTSIVDIPEGPFNITNAITVVTWVNVLASPTHFTDAFGHGDTSWRISVNQNSPPQPGAADGSAPDVTDGTGISLNAWHMLAYTYTGGVGAGLGTLYVDGAPVGTEDFTAPPIGNNLDVWIGGAPDYGLGNSGRLIPAEIAHCAIFAHALSAEAIQGLYNGVFTAPVSLTITRSGQNVVITWPTGVLLQAPTVNGPWTTNSATSPFTTSAASGTEFYKVLVSH